MALQIPARSGPGAMGEVRGKKEEVPAHLLVVLDRWEKVGKVLDGGGQGAAAEVQRRRGSPVRDWRQEEAGEIRGPKVELARGSRGSEKVWSGGFTVASSSPEFGRRQWCSGVSGWGFGEEARETE